MISLLAAVSCASPGAAPRNASAATTELSESSKDGEESRAHAGMGASAAEKGQGPSLLRDEREADPSRALPELSFRHLGMHIGGESNAPDSKRPWFDDIEAGTTELLSCYSQVRSPMRGGSYGVDLYVGSKGGTAEIRGSRQKIGGDDFDACMRSAFLGLNFHRPERPTVLSYSLLFVMKE